MKAFKFETWHPMAGTIVVAAIVLFVSSSVRHALFQSTAFDLGIFDQAIYLISQNQTPYSSLMGIHIMGDHAALIFFPLSLLYKISPSVHWLFLLQAISLALGAWPSWSLSRQAGLNEGLSRAIAMAYLLYPVVFNVNLFDFHPEVMAIPAFLAAILAARLDKPIGFTIAILFILSCKAVLSITVAAMGFWLFFFEKKRLCGSIALGAGVAWFLISTQVFIPYFRGGRQPGAVGRYDYLGKSVLEIVANLFLKPYLIFGQVFSGKTLEYLVLLTLPVIWWLSPRYLVPLISAVPVLMMNILSKIDAQRDLIHQYSVAVVPFLMLAVIATLAARGEETNRLGVKVGSFYLPLPKLIVIWSFIGFLALAKYGYFGSIYLNSLDTWQASRSAIALIPSQSPVLTDNILATHLAHRPVVKLLHQVSPTQGLQEFEYVLLNLRHPWSETKKIGDRLADQLKRDRQFQLKYQQDDVLLFQRQVIPPSS